MEKRWIVGLLIMTLVLIAGCSAQGDDYYRQAPPPSQGGGGGCGVVAPAQDASDVINGAVQVVNTDAYGL